MPATKRSKRSQPPDQQPHPASIPSIHLPSPPTSPKSISSSSKRRKSPPGKTDENVFLFVPNLIGYTRVVLAMVALTYMPTHPKYCTVTYLVSSLLDAVDGVAARALGQTSKFGAVLDMVTDRCATACLLCFLSSAYPRWALLFQFLITLDFSSHYIHMYNSLISGSSSHKLVSRETSRILWSYYNNNKTLFFFCAGNELHFVCLYLMAFYHTPLGLSSTTHILPYLARIHPDAIKFVHPYLLHRVDLLTWPELLAAVTFPVCAVKQVINVVQFWKASKGLADCDREERWKKLHRA